MHNGKLKLLVIDDHPFFLEGLKFGLEAGESNFTIATATSPVAALAGLEHKRDYDLVLCDLNLPEMSGLSFVRKLIEKDIWCPVAIISASEHHSDINQAVHSGACGYINKTLDKQEIIRVIDSILSGSFYVPPSFQGQSETPYQAESVAGNLGITQRQFEVLQLMAQGMSNKDISEQMGVTISTIKSHIKALFQILNVSNRTACILCAAKMSLLSASQLPDGIREID